MLYLIYAESANYCGYGQYFVVEAENEDTAEDIAIGAAEDYFRDQDEEQLKEEGLDPDEMCSGFASVMSADPFGPDHECRQYYQDPKQAEFYIKVNL